MDDPKTTAALRLIKFISHSGGKFSAFVALTDEELAEFECSPDLKQHTTNVVHVCEGHDPTYADISAAQMAFAHAH